MKRNGLATLVLLGSVALAAQTQDSKPIASPRPPIKVTILGSGSGPRVNLQRFGASILVETSMGDRFLFDCGRGFAERLTQYGLSIGAIDKLFLTHLHSDHILSIPDLFLEGWLEGRKGTLQVWGPSGTKSMMDYINKAFEFDIRVRADFDDRLSEAGAHVTATEIQEGVIDKRNGATVTAFLVDHGPVKPAFGYRVDYAGHSVVLSGDTRSIKGDVKKNTSAATGGHLVIQPCVVMRRCGSTSP
jgi:ribonuclease Z